MSLKNPRLSEKEYSAMEDVAVARRIPQAMDWGFMQELKRALFKANQPQKRKAKP